VSLGRAARSASADGRPTLCVSAPARANLIGNPSDLYGGAVLACSVPLRATVTLEPASGTELRAGDRTARVEGPADLALRGDVFDIARAALRSLDRLPACRIRYRTRIPMQSGLAGSTALLVALLRGLLAWRGEDPDPYLLVKRARAVERDILGVACGWVDFYMCAFGGLRYVDLRGLEIERPSTEAPSASLETLPGGAPPFLLAFTGVRHDSGAVHAPLRERWERGDPPVVRAYERVSEIAREGRAALLRADWAGLGALMNENHEIQRGLGGSGAANDRLIRAALDAGAPGAKLAGAGQGGTIVALWPGEDRSPLERALLEAGAAALFRPEPVEGVRWEAVRRSRSPLERSRSARGPRHS
jgi:galactokinase/mevalonate kinase-like predicted kinase